MICVHFVTMCVLYVSLRSSVTPSILGYVFMSTVVLSICRCASCFVRVEHDVVIFCPCV